MNLKHYNNTQDRVGAFLGQGLVALGAWSEVLGHGHIGGSLEDNQWGRGGLMATGQWSQAAHVLRKLFSSFTNSRSVTDNSVGSSPTDRALMSRWSTQFLLPEQSTFDGLFYSKQSPSTLGMFLNPSKENQEFFLYNTNEGAPSTLSPTYFWVQFCVDYFYLCTWDAKWTTPDFPAANKGWSLWFSIFKNGHVPPTPIHKVEIKIVCMKICKELLVGNSWKVLEPRDFKSPSLCKKFSKKNLGLLKSL